MDGEQSGEIRMRPILRWYERWLPRRWRLSIALRRLEAIGPLTIQQAEAEMAEAGNIPLAEAEIKRICELALARTATSQQPTRAER